MGFYSSLRFPGAKSPLAPFNKDTMVDRSVHISKKSNSIVLQLGNRLIDAYLSGFSKTHLYISSLTIRGKVSVFTKIL
jgi:hypothetical protein